MVSVLKASDRLSRLLTVRFNKRDRAYRSFSEFGASIPILGLSQIQVWSDKNKRRNSRKKFVCPRIKGALGL